LFFKVSKITNIFPFRKGFFEIILKTKTHQPNTNLPDKLVWAGIPKTPAGKKHIETPQCDVSTIFMREWHIPLPSACGIGNPASLLTA